MYHTLSATPPSSKAENIKDCLTVWYISGMYSPSLSSTSPPSLSSLRPLFSYVYQIEHGEDDAATWRLWGLYVVVGCCILFLHLYPE